MHNDYSLTALRQFIDFVRDKGLASRSTAQGWAVAVNKVLEHVPESEATDVRGIDLDAAIRRFNNKNPGTLSPKSLGEYRRRVAQVIAEFLAWAEEPTSYKPRGATPTRKKEQTGKGVNDTTRQRSVVDRSNDALVQSRAGHTGLALSMNFPLRPDFLVQVTLPRDLKTDEARRIGAFLLTLASDYAPAS
jgi:hypothetical protein